MPTFADIAARPYEEVKRPPAFPVGTYLCVTEGLPEDGVSREKKTPFKRFKCKIIKPHKDVDPKDLAAWEQASADHIDGKYLYPTFYEPNLTMMGSNESFADWFAHLKMPKGMVMSQAFSESMGRQHLITLKHAPSQDGKSIVNEIVSTAAV